MSFRISQNDVENELRVLNMLFHSIPKGMDSMEYAAGQCSGLILCLSRLKLINDEQREAYTNELTRMYALGSDQHELNATRATVE